MHKAFASYQVMQFIGLFSFGPRCPIRPRDRVGTALHRCNEGALVGRHVCGVPPRVPAGVTRIVDVLPLTVLDDVVGVTVDELAEASNRDLVDLEAKCAQGRRKVWIIASVERAAWNLVRGTA